MNHKITTKVITEGAIYVAIYALFGLIGRFLITGTDSMLYYFLPVPIAIYSARQHIVPSLICSTASIVIVFLFANPLFVLIIYIPNILAGFLFGTLEVKIKSKVITYLISFILILLADVLSVVLATDLGGVDYFKEISEFGSKIFSLFGNVDEDVLQIFFRIVGIVVIILDSVVKTVLVGLVFNLLAQRLKLVPGFKEKITIKLIYNPLISLGFIVLMVIYYFVVQSVVLNNSLITEILFGTLAFVTFIYGVYLIYQACMFIRLKKKDMKFGGIMILCLLAFILFPISILFSLVINFIPLNNQSPNN